MSLMNGRRVMRLQDLKPDWTSSIIRKAIMQYIQILSFWRYTLSKNHSTDQCKVWLIDSWTLAWTADPWSNCRNVWCGHHWRSHDWWYNHPNSQAEYRFTNHITTFNPLFRHNQLQSNEVCNLGRSLWWSPVYNRDWMNMVTYSQVLTMSLSMLS